MDAYNEGCNAGISNAGQNIGPATFSTELINAAVDPDSKSVGFYAVSYTIGNGVIGIAPGTTVISYRGTV